MNINTRKESPDFVAFVSDIDLKNDLTVEQVNKIDKIGNWFFW